MKEPERIPLNPDTPRTHKPKSYPLKALFPETMNDDLYRPDRDSIYVPIDNNKQSTLYKIHDDFYVQSDDPNILEHYENTKKSTET